MKNFLKIVILGMCFQGLFLLGPTGCGGGNTSPQDSQNPAENPTDITPPVTQHETREFDISVQLSDSSAAALSLDNDLLISDGPAAVSLFSQVTHVTIEVLISGVVFSTTELTHSTTDPLVYSGRISIPVDAEAELHATATDATARLLFEGRLRGLHAAEFGTPAIQITMQRQIPVEPVPPPNTPPVIQGTIVARASLAYGSTTRVTVDAQDPQHDVLSYLWEVISGPDGATLTGLLTDEHLQGATFTAPSVTGIFRLRVTVSDPAGATASREVSVYVSESGRDGTPDTGITLSDFPDCVDLGGGCYGPDRAGNISYFPDLPERQVLNPRFRYTVSGITRDYTATQLFNMGFQFSWSDNCNGDNFVGLDSLQNEILTTTSTSFVPTFIKNGLANEACQITLRMTNPDGLFQTYQTVVNFSDGDNNISDEMNCDRDPSTTRPKVRLTCPATMMGVPQIIQLDTCDAQNDISEVRVDGYHWFWQRNSLDKIIFAKNYTRSFTVRDSGRGGSYRILFLPYSNYIGDGTYNITSSHMSAVNAQGVIDTSVQRSALIRPIAIQLNVHVSDRGGGYRGYVAQCIFSVDPSMPLDIPTDYFTR